MRLQRKLPILVALCALGACHSATDPNGPLGSYRYTVVENGDTAYYTGTDAQFFAGLSIGHLTLTLACDGVPLILYFGQTTITDCSDLEPTGFPYDKHVNVTSGYFSFADSRLANATLTGTGNVLDFSTVLSTDLSGSFSFAFLAANQVDTITVTGHFNARPQTGS